MTKEQANRIISEHEAMVVGCTYNVLFTNDIVCGLVIDAVEAVRKSPLYRQKTKQEVNHVEREKKGKFVVVPDVKPPTMIFVRSGRSEQKAIESYIKRINTKQVFKR